MVPVPTLQLSQCETCVTNHTLDVVTAAEQSLARRVVRRSLNGEAVDHAAVLALPDTFEYTQTSYMTDLAPRAVAVQHGFHTWLHTRTVCKNDSATLYVRDEVEWDQSPRDADAKPSRAVRDVVMRAAEHGGVQLEIHGWELSLKAGRTMAALLGPPMKTMMAANDKKLPKRLELAAQL